MAPWRESHHPGVWTSHWFIPCLLPNASMNLTADQPRAVRSPYFLTSTATSNSYAGNMQLMHESRQHFVIALHHPHCEFLMTGGTARVDDGSGKMKNVTSVCHDLALRVPSSAFSTR